MQGGFKVCYGRDEQTAVETAHRLWANEQLPGELAQVLPAPAHFEQASQLVTKEMVGESMAAGPDPAAHLEAVKEYVDAGFEEVYVGNIGPHTSDMLQMWGREVLPQLR